MRLQHAAIAGGLVVAAVLIFGGGPDRRTVIAEFDDVRGLVTGAQVRLAGVPVGEVSGIWLGPDGWPRVAMSIDSDVFPARAAVRMASLSGEFNGYVSVVQGDGPAPSFIPRSRTASPVEIDQVLGTFDPATERELRGVLRGLRTALWGEGSALAATLRESEGALLQTDGLAQDVGDDGAALRLALSSTDTIAATLARSSPDLQQAVDGSATLLRTLSARASAIGSGLASLPAGVGAAQATLARAQTLIGPANRLLTVIAPAIRRSAAVADELRSALVAATPTLEGAAAVATSAPGAARAFTPVLDAAGPLLGLMIPVLRRIGPMLDQLRVRLPDAFSFFANWADFTSNYDANGHGARVGIVLPPAPVSVLSPTSDGAGQLQPPYLRAPGSLDGEPWTDYWKSFVAGRTR